MQSSADFWSPLPTSQVLEKFRLDLSESDARAYFDDVLQQSSTLTVIFDRVHDMGQFFRS